MAEKSQIWWKMQVYTEENLQDVGLSQQFLDLTPKAQSNIEKNW